MVEQKVLVINPTGLHLRPAADLAKLSSSCKSKVTMLYQNSVCNLKSSLNIMALAVKKGSEVTIVCDGETEKEDLLRVVSFIESGLGEI
jgi:Phosphotransferase System HPr (HPr) Family